VECSAEARRDVIQSHERRHRYHHERRPDPGLHPDPVEHPDADADADQHADADVNTNEHAGQYADKHADQHAGHAGQYADRASSVYDADPGPPDADRSRDSHAPLTRITAT
jgi:hypothetical protein